jgi:hypothetical protein
VQRFVANPVLCALWESGALDLNRLEIAFQTGRSGLTLRQYAEIMMGLGYSVSGFRDLSTFESMEIENPLWKKNPS